MSRAMSLDQIAATDDLKYAYLKAFGGEIRVGSLSADVLLDFVEANEGPAKRKAGLRILVLSLVDDDGNRIGGSPDGDDASKALFEKNIKMFGGKNHDTIIGLVAEVLKLNGMDVKKKSVDAAKNDSSEAPSDASRTS